MKAPAILALVSICLVPSASLAGAERCASAATPVDRVICANEALSDQRSAIEAALRDLLPLVARSERDTIEPEQRQWSASLAAACGAARLIEACLRPRLATREHDVDERLDRARAYGPGDPLQLGPATVVVEPMDRGADGTASTRTADGKRASIPFFGDSEIVRRLDRSDLKAALILEGEGGTAHCGNYAVVSFQSSTGVRHTPLTSDFPCADDEAPFELTGETPDGLYISQEPAPFEPRVKIVWTAPGTVTTIPLAFQPMPGTRLRDARPDAEPLQSDDLFQAIERETGSDSRVFQRALWHLHAYDEGGARPPPQGGSEQSRLDRYGSRREGDLLVLRGCGWNADHSGLWCGDLDALAIADADGHFFFAIRSGKPSPAAPRIYPALDNWPKAARSVFEAWRASPS